MKLALAGLLILGWGGLQDQTALRRQRVIYKAWNTAAASMAKEDAYLVELQESLKREPPRLVVSQRRRDLEHLIVEEHVLQEECFKQMLEEER